MSVANGVSPSRNYPVGSTRDAAAAAAICVNFFILNIHLDHNRSDIFLKSDFHWRKSDLRASPVHF